MITFTNPRLSATFTDWPLGGSKRGTCVFTVTHKPGKGWRFERVTTGKPKCSTYGGLGAIVDGSDGRTYLLQKAGAFDFIKIMRSDFMSAAGEVGRGSVFPNDPNDEEYANLMAIIASVNSD